MGGWYTAVFEFGSLDARNDFLHDIETSHPVAFPDPAAEKQTAGHIITNSGSEADADIAWIGNYVYVTCRENYELLVRASRDRWRRAAYALFNPASATCERARLFTTDGDPIQTTTYDGVDGAAGNGLLYEFTMRHQFRFRSYAAELPAPQQTPSPSAYDAIEPTEDTLTTLADLTGVARTDAGVAFLESDYTQTTDFVDAHDIPVDTARDDAPETDQHNLHSLYAADN